MGTQGRGLGTEPNSGEEGFTEILRMRLRFLVLTLLAIRPTHGYELSRMIEELTLGTLKPGPGSLYPLLRELSTEGLVSEESVVEGGRLRKVYALTPRGREVLASGVEVAQRILENILELLRLASQRLRSAPGEGCVPPEVVEYLGRLEAKFKKLRETLSQSLCSGREKNS